MRGVMDRSASIRGALRHAIDVEGRGAAAADQCEMHPGAGGEGADDTVVSTDPRYIVGLGAPAVGRKLEFEGAIRSAHGENIAFRRA